MPLVVNFARAHGAPYQSLRKQNSQEEYVNEIGENIWTFDGEAVPLFYTAVYNQDDSRALILRLALGSQPD